jgi:hypothetical protein
MQSFPFIEFHQYGSPSLEDRLIVFAAPAATLAQWAGIPSKGWHVRLLYQRWVTRAREKELEEFWTAASIPPYILGPTALTIAVRGEPVIVDGQIVLEREPIIDAGQPLVTQLGVIAASVIPELKARLTPLQQQVIDGVLDGSVLESPDAEHDYVFESAVLIAQMAREPESFSERNNLAEEDLHGLVQALDAISRPALVVDGQHRLYGSARTSAEIWLPVVAIPRCSWMDQIYQFIVINEKAQRVETSLLTDIFGSSLTVAEQVAIRRKLERSRVSVEERIAAVIAARDPRSPFYNMVNIKLQGEAPSGARPFLTELTIRALIEGGRGTRAWRSDDEFYQHYIQPTFPDPAQWNTWTDGQWRAYWFAFWNAVGDFYNNQALEAEATELWTLANQTNLTKAVTLRLFQRLFMEKAIERMEDVERSREVLIDAVGEEQALALIAAKLKEKAIPDTPEKFADDIRDWFLNKGVPVRFFLKTWKASLDDAQGQDDLWLEIQKAYDLTHHGKRYHTRNTAVFAVDEGDDQ